VPSGSRTRPARWMPSSIWLAVRPRHALSPSCGPVLVSAVSKPDQAEATRRGARALFFLVNVTTARLTQIAGMIDPGELIVDVGVTLPLADAARAHEMPAGLRQHPRGKIVLRTGA
jgi:NADPH:quinone reductase-like Zn-dependent oxidoreductase